MLGYLPLHNSYSEKLHYSFLCFTLCDVFSIVYTGRKTPQIALTEEDFYLIVLFRRFIFDLFIIKIQLSYFRAQLPLE